MYHGRYCGNHNNILFHKFLYNRPDKIEDMFPNRLFDNYPHTHLRNLLPPRI